MEVILKGTPDEIKKVISGQEEITKVFEPNIQVAANDVKPINAREIIASIERMILESLTTS